MSTQTKTDAPTPAPATAQRLTDLLDQHSVPHWPVVFAKDDAGKKRPVRGMGPGWQAVDAEEAAKRRLAMPDGNANNVNWHQSQPGARRFCVFDCDVPEAAEHFAALTGRPWDQLTHTLSVTKGLPHFIVELPAEYTPPKTAVKWMVDGVEVGDIKFTNTWERNDASIHGSDTVVLDPEWLPGLKPAPAPAPAPAAPAPAPKATASTPSVTNEATDHALNVNGAQLDERGEWITFVAACANSGVPQSVCLEVSARSSKHRPGPDAKAIADIYAKGTWRAGMGSLCRLSKLSDPSNYHRLQAKHFWKPKTETDLLDNAFSDTAYAKVFLSLCADSVGWTRTGELTCYDEQSGLWSLGKKAEAMIRNLICDTLLRLLLHKIPDIADSSKRASLLALCAKLGQQKTRKALFECVRDLAYQQCAQFEIDRHPGTERWFAFKDCIYDADTGERMPYHPEAYISQRLPYDCPVSEPPQTAALRAIAEQIFPNETERELYLLCLAQGLTGDTNWETHVNSNGKSGAGKSLLVKDLAANAFGIYAATWPSNIFSQDYAGRRKKNFTAALTRPIRFAIVEEMSLTRLDEECFKTWTSGGVLSVDTDYATEANENISMVTIFSLTNNPLNLHDIKGINQDRLQALKRRIKFFNMKSRFVPAEKVEEEKEAGTKHVFVVNTQFKKDFQCQEEYHQAFAWLMMEQWTKLAARNWQPPNFALLDAQLEEHLQENAGIDPLHQWLRENYQPCPDTFSALEKMVADHGEGKMSKAAMKEAIFMVFGRSVEGQPMYDRAKKVDGCRGCVRLKRAHACATNWE